MNYLAHLYLAGPDPEARLGNLMGDFVKGPVPAELPAGLQRGIVLHRRIDSFTDGHPMFRRSRQRLSPEFRRYGGILIDVFYDHLLIRHWPDFHAQALDDFIEEVHQLLQRRLPDLPAAMQRSMRYLLANDLLRSYGDPAGVARALAGLERRLSRPSNLAAAVTELEFNYPGLSTDFRQFFPELIAHVESHKQQLHHR